MVCAACGAVKEEEAIGVKCFICTYQPEIINPNFLKARDMLNGNTYNDKNDTEDQTLLSMISDAEESSADGKSESHGTAELNDNDDIITISDSDESLGEASGHQDDEIEEFTDDFFPATLPPQNLPGVVEVAPTHPTLSQHYW